MGKQSAVIHFVANAAHLAYFSFLNKLFDQQIRRIMHKIFKNLELDAVFFGGAIISSHSLRLKAMGFCTETCFWLCKPAR